VFANLPFNRTSAILHRLLDDPAGGLVRADLVVQWQVARALARTSDDHAVDLVGASWAPWWTFGRGRRLPATLFRPAPSVDAAVLTVARRHPSELPVEAAPAFVRFVGEHFGGRAARHRRRLGRALPAPLGRSGGVGQRSSWSRTK
jgi:23S rRNA (adenine-N6)-dimethyltransferase